jgi:hypothetical protein
MGYTLYAQCLRFLLLFAFIKIIKVQGSLFLSISLKVQNQFIFMEENAFPRNVLEEEEGKKVLPMAKIKRQHGII